MMGVERGEKRGIMGELESLSALNLQGLPADSQVFACTIELARGWKKDPVTRGKLIGVVCGVLVCLL